MHCEVCCTNPSPISLLFIATEVSIASVWSFIREANSVVDAKYKYACNASSSRASRRLTWSSFLHMSINFLYLRSAKTTRMRDCSLIISKGRH